MRARRRSEKAIEAECARLEEFTSSAAMRRVLGQQKGIDLCEAMDRRIAEEFYKSALEEREMEGNISSYEEGIS